jgi:hypothetical protein
LTEAINAMFRWYKNAAVCYVYLSDVIAYHDKSYETLCDSRWFTRGWTLQELIAPQNVEFYSRDWWKLATKDDLCVILARITGIDQDILRGADLADVSVAKRMSWASHRETTRTEDMAYCLFGIFDVNLPLIYGEGAKAFRRLQEAIMITTHDQSLFAWGSIVEHPSELIDRNQELGLDSIVWKPPQEREPLLGLFASSPKDFDTSSEIFPVDNEYAHQLNRWRPPTLVNGGVYIDLVIFKTLLSALHWDCPPIAQPQKIDLAILLCRVGNIGSQLVGLILHPWGDGYHSRTKELVLVDTFVSRYRFQRWTQPRHVMPQRPSRLRNGDILLRRWKSAFKCVGVTRPNTKSGPAWRQKWSDRVIRLEEDAVGDEDISFYFEISNGKGIAITLKRIAKTMEPIGPLLIGASHILRLDKSREKGAEEDFEWIPVRGVSLRSPEYSHVMNIPSDTWQFEDKKLPGIYVKVDRMLLDVGWGAVDVVDFFLCPNGSSILSLPRTDSHSSG